LSGVLYQLLHFIAPVSGEAWSENSHIFIAKLVIKWKTKPNLSANTSGLRLYTLKLFLIKLTIIALKEWRKDLIFYNAQ